ncbi:helix-turn-helix domain-containing protein [Cognatishimia sp.]|uniref:helix-turn-helix domain-containing protein n=1 Tax=Cognatishimia sp. TaxID=2211648 RepID=UPI00351286F4
MSSARDGEDILFSDIPARDRVEDNIKAAYQKHMGNAALLTLAGLCLGIAASGLFTGVLRQDKGPARLSLGLVYCAFIGMIALPLVKAFAAPVLVNYMPVLLILLLVLPPAFYHFVMTKTSDAAKPDLSLRDGVLPALGVLVCVGYWILPAPDKDTMFIAGELPEGALPAVLAFATFMLIAFWPLSSFLYLVAILRRLKAFRTRLRHLYSDADTRDLRWIDVMAALLVLIWGTGAVYLANENFADGALLIEEVFLVLIGAGLVVLNVFVPTTSPDLPPEVPEDTPNLKYARSALTHQHSAKLAARIEAAMRQDKLYLDPGLSLQKLSKHIGALPNQVSQTLNQDIGATFFDYVARWRIEASKPLIAAGDASVLTVALDVGFNSRSTFYKAFNRETGMTPKAYRASLQNAA